MSSGTSAVYIASITVTFDSLSEQKRALGLAHRLRGASLWAGLIHRFGEQAVAEWEANGGNEGRKHRIENSGKPRRLVYDVRAHVRRFLHAEIMIRTLSGASFAAVLAAQPKLLQSVRARQLHR